MKRDMDLVRSILLVIEKEATLSQEVQLKQNLEGHTDEEIYYHVKMMEEAGLIKVAEYLRRGGIPSPIIFGGGITWAGHDFLELSRQNNV